MIRHLIFDMDGTLVDSCAICVDILSGMLAARGSDRVVDPVEARGFMSRGGTYMVAGLLGDACQDPDSDLAEFRQRYARTATPRQALFAGVGEGLVKLRAAGFTLSICSNKPQNLCDKVLKDTGLDPLFEVVVGGAPGLRAKPAPDLLDAALERLGAMPSECLFIGDSELDHQIADAASIPFLFLSYGYAEAGWSPQGLASFACFTELAQSILNATAQARAA